MARITGRIIDKQTGETVEARVQILSSGGSFLHPSSAILKVGPGVPFFYSDGEFVVDAPRGLTQITVERGTEYVPASVTLDVAKRGVTTVDIELERWSTLGEQGWHPGNTHIHYDEKEQRPDERLYLDPRVEDLRVTAISLLTRQDLPYASNKYPPGFLTDFSSAHHHVECGEESRHNRTPWAFGYGHIMLLRIREVVEPISRGLLVDDLDPDYPPLCYACDEAHRQGGVVIWCHNGQGMEAPVATALGKLDAFNLFDPFWMDPEYDLWYAMHKIPISLLDLEDGFTNSFDELTYYLDLHTGKVVLVTESDRAILDSAWENLDNDTMLGEELLRQYLQEANLPAWQVESALEALPVELDGDDRFCPIPQQTSWESYSDMEAYIETLSEGHLADLLAVAIRGKGAFRRFKDVLGDYPAQRQAWFSFDTARKRERMRAWLDSLETEFEVVE